MGLRNIKGHQNAKNMQKLMFFCLSPYGVLTIDFRILFIILKLLKTMKSTILDWNPQKKISFTKNAKNSL